MKKWDLTMTKELNNVYADRIIQRGKKYLENVDYCLMIKNKLYSEVEGTYNYKTEVDLNTLKGTCSCPYEDYCKHMVATYLVYKKGDYLDGDDFIKHIHTLNKEQMIELIEKNIINNSDMVLLYQLKKRTNINSFVREFTNNFSYENLKKADKLFHEFNKTQFKKMLNFLRKKDEVVFEKLCEETDHWSTAEDLLYTFEKRLDDAIKTKKS